MYRSHRAFLSPGDALGPRDSIGATDWTDAAPYQRRYEHPKSPSHQFHLFTIISRQASVSSSPSSAASPLPISNTRYLRAPLFSSFPFVSLIYWQRAHCGVCSLLLGAPSGDQPRVTGTAVRPVST